VSLDVFLSRSPDDVVVAPEDEAAFAGLNVHVNEWVGTGSFGGKRYIEVVDHVGDVVLGYKWVPPEDVVRMAAAFEARDPEEVARESVEDAFPVTADQVRGLRQLFRFCADRGLGLLGM